MVENTVRGKNSPQMNANDEIFFRETLLPDLFNPVTDTTKIMRTKIAFGARGKAFAFGILPTCPKNAAYLLWLCFQLTWPLVDVITVTGNRQVIIESQKFIFLIGKFETTVAAPSTFNPINFRGYWQRPAIVLTSSVFGRFVSPLRARFLAGVERFNHRHGPCK